MSTVEALGSGKGHKDENFPVASFILRPQHRAVIMAFYRFARAADDVADSADAPADRKIALLDAMGATLAGDAEDNLEAKALREALNSHNLSPVHGQDLLRAFRQDAVKPRYADWQDLLDYCRYSASPVGRFVLDVHGESPALWPMNDALCTALQVINHLQDCAEDYRDIDRVYLPQDDLARAGIGVEALAADRASPPLRKVIVELAARTAGLLHQSRPFAHAIRDPRLAWEVAIIQRLAESLTVRLMRKDPLCERVHHKPWEALGLLVLATGDRVTGRGRSGSGPLHVLAGTDAR